MITDYSKPKHEVYITVENKTGAPIKVGDLVAIPRTGLTLTDKMDELSIKKGETSAYVDILNNQCGLLRVLKLEFN